MIPPRAYIKLRQLEYFLAVARTLNFSKAADLLFVTQPMMSHQIADLESQIGAVLFNRNGKAVRLTEPVSSSKPMPAFAKNLTNRLYNAEYAPGGFVFKAEPRQYGLEFSKTF